MTATRDDTAVPEYLRKVSAGLRGIDEAQKQEILAEIGSHLRERVAELEAQGAPDPSKQALSSLGNPADLASQFLTEAQARRGRRSYAPWTLLRSAARLARTGGKGFLLFLIGITGYGLPCVLKLAAFCVVGHFAAEGAKRRVGMGGSRFKRAHNV